MIDTKTNNAKKSIKILCITAVLVLIAAGIAGSYWFCPVIYASFRSLFWPEKVYWIETLCGSYGSIMRSQHLVPPRFREYFEYGAGIFRGSQRLVKMTKEYTQRLKDAGYEAEGRFQNALRKNYSHISATYATEHDNAVDLIEKK